MIRRFVPGCVVLILAGTAGAREPAAPETLPPAVSRPVDFVRDVQPILVKRCVGCHGPDQQKSGLRLDRKADALSGGRSGPAFRKGKSAESRLIRFVAGADPDVVMPPRGARLSDQEVGVLRAWIDQGAEWPDHADGTLAAARRHWAFQPVVRPKLPPVKDRTWAHNPIDAFVLAGLEREGVAPSPPADRATLIRRLSLDLLGLPPSPDEADAALGDRSPDWYERLVDRLLASPRLGERWGRHWLDLARYADSDGYEDDRNRPDAWRYRDWVIAAFNDDLPFDRFTIEQLAGDLLPDAGYGQQVAAGFHRMTLLNRSAMNRNLAEEFRVKTAKDRVGTTGTVWLGLTLGCAECHSHKYDPISQRDYYRFYAFFNNLADTDVAAPPLPERYAAAHKKALQEFEDGQARAKAALAAYEKERLPARQAEWEQSADRRELPPEVAAVLAVEGDKRTREQTRRLGDYFRSIDVEYVRLQSAVLVGDEVPNNRPQPPSTRALTVKESASPQRTFVQVRGDFQSAGEEVQPGVPEFLPPLEAGERGTSTPRPATRLDLARWLVDSRHPLTARVAVNHVWQHLFGRGLAAATENLGVRGERPSHPELLDWLASEFMSPSPPTEGGEGRVRGWSRKQLIRLIVTSSTYRQSSRYRPELAGRDPQNTWLARQNRLRVEGEIVRDLGLAAGGLLNPELGGPSVQPPLPAALMSRRELKNERFMPPSSGADRYRRGVYVNVQRTFPYPMLKDFDSADANVACSRRDRSNTPLQALTVLNDPVFVECAKALGVRVAGGTGGRQERIHQVFRLCLTRGPTEREAKVLGQVYELHRTLYTADSKLAVELLGDLPVPEGVSPAEAAAWVAVARTVLNLDEFITRE